MMFAVVDDDDWAFVQDGDGNFLTENQAEYIAGLKNQFEGDKYRVIRILYTEKKRDEKL